MKIFFVFMLFFLPLASFSSECVYKIRINEKHITLNKTNYVDIIAYFGDAKKIRSIYEIPYYGICYKNKSKKSSIVFGFESNSNLLKFVQISPWNNVLGEYIDCASLELNSLSINGKFIGGKPEKSGSPNRILLSRNYCHVRESESSFSGVLIDFGIFLNDLE